MSGLAEPGQQLLAEPRGEKPRSALLAQAALVRALALAKPPCAARALKTRLQSGWAPPQRLPTSALSGGLELQIQPPDSHRRDQRCKAALAQSPPSLTSHHLLGFIWLHVPIVLHHLLQPCLATSHLRRVEGVRIVLQDSQLQEGKVAEGLGNPLPFRGIMDQLKPQKPPRKLCKQQPEHQPGAHITAALQSRCWQPAAFQAPALSR